jgi:hypothetical protein
MTDRMATASFQAEFGMNFSLYGPATDAPKLFQAEKWNDGTWSDNGQVIGFKFSGVGKGATTSDSTVAACSAMDSTGAFYAVGRGDTVANQYQYVALMGYGGFADNDDCTPEWLGLYLELAGLPTGRIDTYLSGITPSGLVAIGAYHDMQYQPHAWAVKPLTVQEFFAAPPTGMTDAQITGVSDNGLILYGYGTLPLGGNTSAQNLIRWTTTDLATPYVSVNLGNFPAAFGTYPARVSSNGSHVVGEYLDMSYRSHPFVYSDQGGFVDLGAGAPADSLYGQAYASNSDGSVITGWGAHGYSGYTWTAAGGMSLLPPLGGLLYSIPECMSSDRAFIGGESDDAAFSVACAQIWTSSGRTYNLQNLLSVATVDLSNWTLNRVTSIVKNSDGSYLFTGNGVHNSIKEGWVLQLSIHPTVITSHPQVQHGVVGGQASFSVQTNAAGPVTYQWENSHNGGMSWRKLHDTGAYAGTSTNTLTVSPVDTSMNDHIYRCVCGFETGFTIPQTETSRAAALTVPVAAKGDFNGDGKIDLIWENTGTGERYAWMLNGPTFLSSAYLGTVAPAWHIAGAADFNNDGKIDLFWQNLSTGDLYLWLMSGTSFQSSVYLGNIDPQWHMVATGDFNGDGYADLVWENTSTGDRYLWRMTGTAFRSSVYLGNVPPAWHIAAVADFNGDGKVDLLWQNTSTGEIYVWLMNGTTFVSSVFLGVVPTDWSIAAAGDFNGDGKPDIAWQNMVTGDRIAWMMAGTNYSSSAYIGRVPINWKIDGF